MKYPTLLLLFAGLALGTSATAQSTPADPELDADLRNSYQNAELRARLNNLSRSGANPSDVMITQVGTNHQAFVETQALTGTRPTDVDLVQRGGSGNVARINVVGDGSTLALTQEGSNNRYTGNLSATEAELTILQQGNGNELSQRTLLTGNSDIEIRQFGDGNVLNADNVSSPIRVTQRDGAKATLSTIVSGAGANRP